MTKASPNLYDVLGVPRDATPKRIKEAYRKLAKEHHPDSNPGDPTAEDKFKEVTTAYETLGDPEKRAGYDEEQQEQQPPHSRGTTRPTKAYNNETSRDGYDDPFNMFFGGFHHFGQKQPPPASQKKSARVKGCEAIATALNTLRSSENTSSTDRFQNFAYVVLLHSGPHPEYIRDFMPLVMRAIKWQEKNEKTPSFFYERFVKDLVRDSERTPAPLRLEDFGSNLSLTHLTFAPPLATEKAFLDALKKTTKNKEGFISNTDIDKITTLYDENPSLVAPTLGATLDCIDVHSPENNRATTLLFSTVKRRLQRITDSEKKKGAQEKLRTFFMDKGNALRPLYDETIWVKYFLNDAAIVTSETLDKALRTQNLPLTTLCDGCASIWRNNKNLLTDKTVNAFLSSLKGEMPKKNSGGYALLSNVMHTIDRAVSARTGENQTLDSAIVLNGIPESSELGKFTKGALKRSMPTKSGLKAFFSKPAYHR